MLEVYSPGRGRGCSVFCPASVSLSVYLFTLSGASSPTIFPAELPIKLLVKLKVRLVVKFFSSVLSVLGTVFLSSRFARKDATFSTGDLFSLGVTRIDRVLAGTGVIQVILQWTDSHQVV